MGTIKFCYQIFVFILFGYYFIFVLVSLIACQNRKKYEPAREKEFLANSNTRVLILDVTKIPSSHLISHTKKRVHWEMYLGYILFRG
jgi:hypothetical protein